jgi:hypothetical protein
MLPTLIRGLLLCAIAFQAAACTTFGGGGSFLPGPLVYPKPVSFKLPATRCAEFQSINRNVLAPIGVRVIDGELCVVDFAMVTVLGSEEALWNDQWSTVFYNGVAGELVLQARDFKVYSEVRGSRRMLNESYTFEFLKSLQLDDSITDRWLRFGSVECESNGFARTFKTFSVIMLANRTLTIGEVVQVCVDEDIKTLGDWTGPGCQTLTVQAFHQR